LREVAYAGDSGGRTQTWWYKNRDWISSKWKGKGKEKEESMERAALRRLVRVGKGVEGDAWVKRVEPG